jgi:predicted enzyme related to lactoylglutathione lyase
MSDYNSQFNRAVWFDIPATDLDRAAAFYAAVLGIKVQKEQMQGGAFCVLEHHNGNGGCLVNGEPDASPSRGILLYLNVDGRIRDAVELVERKGGRVLQPVHGIGPHGFRAIVVDSEGNRIALHSATDA